jgi:hypothetical protein
MGRSLPTPLSYPLRLGHRAIRDDAAWGVRYGRDGHVRSSPYSRHFPHSNIDELRVELRADRISYVFLGKQLGGRPNERRFFCGGVADYEKMALAPEFNKGLDRVIEGAKKYRIALMCSEREPLDCHRCLLVGRALADLGAVEGSKVVVAALGQNPF